MHVLAFAAQVAETADGLGDLAKQGILGLVASLAIGALIWVTKNWKASMEARIEDAKGYGKDLKESNDAASNLVVETNRTTDAMKNALEGLKTEVSGRKSDLGELKGEIVKLREKQTELVAVHNARGAT